MRSAPERCSEHRDDAKRHLFLAWDLRHRLLCFLRCLDVQLEGLRFVAVNSGRARGRREFLAAILMIKPGHELLSQELAWRVAPVADPASYRNETVFG